MNQADRLKEYIEQLRKDAYEEGVKDATKEMSKQMSAIENGQIRHGHWEPSEIPCERWVCSECGGGAWYYDVNGYVRKSKYCPNCGAKMDGGQNDD